MKDLVFWNYDEQHGWLVGNAKKYHTVETMDQELRKVWNPTRNSYYDEYDAIMRFALTPFELVHKNARRMFKNRIDERLSDVLVSIISLTNLAVYLKIMSEIPSPVSTVAAGYLNEITEYVEETHIFNHAEINYYITIIDNVETYTNEY